MDIKEKIYSVSPIFFQNFMTSALGFIHNKQRYGEAYRSRMDFLDKFDSLSYEEKREYQFREFKKFVIYAAQNSRFYKELYKDVDLQGMNSFEDAKALPFVDKEMLRKNMDEVFTIPQKGSVVAFTGGTTGKSMIVRFTKQDFELRMASLDHFKKKAGFVNNEMRRATFNSKKIIPPGQTSKMFWRYNRPGKQMIYSPFFLSEENMPYFIDSLNEFKPQALDGYFMSMCDIARYVERKGIKLKFTPAAIFPTSETITQDGRELLERVFGCKVYNQYASSEGAPFVTECVCGNLHMNMDSGYIETVGEKSSEIAVTSFTTHGTPLIRYRIGDCMTFAEKTQCACGFESQQIESIDGRMMDFVRTASGAKVTEAGLSCILKHIPNAIIQAQFVQNIIGAVELYLVIDNNKYKKEEYEKILSEEFHAMFGTDSVLNIHYAEKIERASSGKFRLIINNVDKR